MKKHKLTKEEKDKLLFMVVEQLQGILKYMKCEAIVYVPDYGTISEFSSEFGRAKVLNHAKREIKLDEINIENDATNWFIAKKNGGMIENGEKDKKRKYIG